MGVGYADWPMAIGYDLMRFITLPPGLVVPRYRRSLNELLSTTMTGPTDVTVGRTRLTGSAYGVAGRACVNAGVSRATDLGTSISEPSRA